jgi:HSP20 family molecular chaperone IbpA
MQTLSSYSGHGKIEARFNKGVLKVVLPKWPEAASEQRKIEIKKASIRAF